MLAATSFVGRSEVRERVLSLLADGQIVTLTGTGGIGKTRLAGEVADARGECGDHVELIELGQAKPGDDLELVLARQLGQSSLDTFSIGLDGRPALVVLDTCEHVLADAASLAERLAGLVNVRVLATSRTPLGVLGECVVKLEPLRVVVESDGEPTPALQLFLDRAEVAGATWLEVPEQRAAADEVVRRLDGLPLAIELAAARTRVVGPSDLLTLLPRQLDLLEASVGPSTIRRRGVREAVQTSYEPMDAVHRKGFRALSLIPRGVDLDLAHALLGNDDRLATLEVLTGLIDRSLVYTSQAAGDTFYRLLEPVRAFGLEQLDKEGERLAVATRYIDSVVAFADRIVVATASSFSGELVDQIAQRYGHLLMAIETAIEIDERPDRAYRLLLPLYAPTRAPRREQALLAARVRERWPDTEDRFRAAAYAIMGHIALWAGNDDPTPYAREALSDPRATRIARIIAHRVLAFYAAQQGDRSLALTHIEAALETSASRGGSFERELKMSWAALVDDPSQIDSAIETAESMMLDASESGETVPVVWAASVCVHQYLRAGNVQQARIAADRAVAFAELSSAPWPTAASQRTLGFVCAAEEQWDESASHLRAALESVVAIGDIEGITVTVRSAAICAQRCGRPDVARRLWHAVPTRYSPSSLPPLFTAAEDELVGELGTPIPLPLAGAVKAARKGLAEPDPASAGRVYRFGDCELDAGRRELRRGEISVHLEPQVFDVLARLIVDAGVLVTKDQLLDDVWGSRFVSPSALSSRIKSARAATGDDGTTQRVIRTVHGRGFMFVADLD
ncbi:MAG: winged helix-turn-helix domain-containing protein [Acidimicrobiia bacterium]|nr:winged helix-turn-helix domain-containing protein [Acidimicrobiia bacterium]